MHETAMLLDGYWASFNLIGGIRVGQAIVFDADLLQQLDLGFQKVDVTFLIGNQFLKQSHRDIVFFFAAKRVAFHVGVFGDVLPLEVAFKYLTDVLADH